MNDIIDKVDELREMLKPYLVCTCGDFTEVNVFEERQMLLCKCGGLMTVARIEAEVKP